MGLILGAQAALGFLLNIPQATGDGVATTGAGDQTWVYVQNSTGAGWAAGTVVMRTNAATTYQCTVAAADTSASRVVGVSQHVIAAGSFGFVLREGMGEVLAGTETIDVNEVIAVSALTAGAAMEGGTIAADAHEAFVIGFATESAAAAALATCHIKCYG